MQLQYTFVFSALLSYKLIPEILRLKACIRSQGWDPSCPQPCSALQFNLLLSPQRALLLNIVQAQEALQTALCAYLNSTGGIPH